MKRYVSRNTGFFSVLFPSNTTWRHTNGEEMKLHKYIIWYDMIWYDYDTIWCFMMIWYTIWYDMMKYDMVRYDMIWCDMMRYDTIRYVVMFYDDMIYDMIRYDEVRYGTVRYDMMRYDTIRYVVIWYDMLCYDMIYMLTAIGWHPMAVVQCTFTRKQWIEQQNKQYVVQPKIWEECGPCPVFAGYTLAFALQLRKEHGKISVRVAEECQMARWKQNIQNRAYITIRIIYNNNYGCSFFPLFLSKRRVCNCAGPAILLHGITRWSSFIFEKNLCFAHGVRWIPRWVTAFYWRTCVCRSSRFG